MSKIPYIIYHISNININIISNHINHIYLKHSKARNNIKYKYRIILNHLKASVFLDMIDWQCKNLAETNCNDLVLKGVLGNPSGHVLNWGFTVYRTYSYRIINHEPSDSDCRFPTMPVQNRKPNQINTEHDQKKGSIVHGTHIVSQ